MSSASATSLAGVVVRPVAGSALWDHAAAWDAISPDPFSGPDWFRLWLDHFGEGALWRPAAAYAVERLVGVASWVEYTERRMGLPIRVLSLASNLYTPVTTLSIDPSLESEHLGAALLDEALSRDWDVMRLEHVPDETGVAAIFRESLRKAGVPFLERDAVSNWYLPVSFSAEEYLAALRKFSPKYIRRRQRKLEQAGVLSLHLFRAGPELDRYVDEYYRVYAASWKKPEPDPTFHRDLARVASNKGWLRLGLCYVDGRAIAAQLWLVRSGVAYIVKLCHDEAWASHSPGVVLTAFLMRHAIDEDRVREVDYLKGDEEYKREWMSDRRIRRRFVAFNPRTGRGRVLATAAMRVRPWVTRLLPMRGQTLGRARLAG